MTVRKIGAGPDTKFWIESCYHFYVLGVFRTNLLRQSVHFVLPPTLETNFPRTHNTRTAVCTIK